MPVSTINGDTLVLHGVVGESYAEDFFTAREVIVALAALGDRDVTVRLNSPGGIATEGLAVFAAIKAHRRPVTVVIEGVAASAGTIVAMAGGAVRMAPSALFMIHDPAVITLGTVAVHEKAIENLEAIAETMAAVYSERTGATAEAMREAMRAETWYRAEQAVEAGFADALDAANDDAEPAAFAYARAYARTPARIVALANTRGWNRDPLARPGGTSETPTMTTKPTAGAPPADTERARIKAILGSEAAAGRETLARHFAFDTDLAPEAALAALAAAPKAADPAEALVLSDDEYARRRAGAAALAMPYPSPAGQRAPVRWSDFHRNTER